MALQLKPEKREDLQMIVHGTTLSISGSVSMSNPAEILEPYIIKLHNKLVEEGIKRITLDLTRLAFLNSSGIREIVNWILLVNALPAEKRYAVHIKYSSKYLWQESSTSTFVYLNPDLVSKEVI
ncbi:MAG: hypothetical protein JXJ04_25655 [Spirochaetales bacterium]|nr:hypothetical protein [Spirochaetales bacterium]